MLVLHSLRLPCIAAAICHIMLMRYSYGLVSFPIVKSITSDQAVISATSDPSVTSSDLSPSGMTPGYNPAYMAQQQGQPSQMMTQTNPNSEWRRTCLENTGQRYRFNE